MLLYILGVRGEAAIKLLELHDLLNLACTSRRGSPLVSESVLSFAVRARFPYIRLSPEHFGEGMRQQTLRLLSLLL